MEATRLPMVGPSRLDLDPVERTNPLGLSPSCEGEAPEKGEEERADVVGEDGKAEDDDEDDKGDGEGSEEEEEEEEGERMGEDDDDDEEEGGGTGFLESSMSLARVSSRWVWRSLIWGGQTRAWSSMQVVRILS